ncbi:hypothetical protein ACIPLC_11420 [Kitasatospora sp. NPDC086801]|uniref:hypothetical protein n=1 Tax=Kitasatospora sp. NPDC086801 TaxID=3364066 RepID=UPI00382E5A08
MSLHAHAHHVGRPPWHLRPAALAAIGAARLVERLPPARIRRVMLGLRRGARPADRAEATVDDVIAALLDRPCRVGESVSTSSCGDGGIRRG